MKTYMVYAVLTADRQIAIPIVVIHCYMSGSRENTGIVFAAEESSPAVYSEMMFFCPKVTESENSFLLTSLTAGLNCHFQSIKIVWCPFTSFIAAFTRRQDLSDRELDEVQQMIDRIRRGETR